MASIHKGVAAGILFLFLFGFVQAEKGKKNLIILAADHLE